MVDAAIARAKGIYVFSLFERFWHWCQAALIIFLLTTGAEIHGFWHLLGFRQALNTHIVAAFALLVLWAFAIFWHIITGQWRQYVPTTERLWATIVFYLLGIFIGAPHPFRPTVKRKHNPLQAMAYLLFKVVMAPLVWISGLILWANGRFHGLFPQDLPIFWVNAAHVAAAFLIATFLFGHLYLITTGETVGAQLRAMITGWDRFGEDEQEKVPGP